MVEVGVFHRVTLSANFRWKDESSPNIVGITKLECHGEDRMILFLFVWVQYQRVTNGQTDRPTDGIAVANTAFCIASNAAAL